MSSEDSILSAVAEKMVKRTRRMAPIPRQFATSLIGGRLQHQLFEQVTTYAMFLGHARSGQTIVGSLLNAHPDMVIAHELDALSYVGWRFGRDQLYDLLLRRDAFFTGDAGLETHSGYGFKVEGEWQGRFRLLKVIGDKKAGTSARYLGQRPEVLDRLTKLVKVPVRVIHVTRNPFDNISTIAKRSQRDLSRACESYFSRCETIDRLRKRTSEEYLQVRYEDFIADPSAELKRACRFLGVEAESEYTRRCSEIVFASPRRTRTDAPWDDDLVGRVQERISRYAFLEGYTFES